MLLDFSKPILDLKGKAIEDGGAVVTFASVVETVLLREADGSNGANKLERYKLALKISNATAPIALTVDEAKLLQDQVKAMCGALVVGRLDEFLNGAE